MKKLFLLTMMAVCLFSASACTPTPKEPDPGTVPEYKPERSEGKSNAPAAPGDAG
jgi:hypothetical protein